MVCPPESATTHQVRGVLVDGGLEEVPDDGLRLGAAPIVEVERQARQRPGASGTRRGPLRQRP